MPTLPEAIDYGARPSLQTGRVDRPTGANAQVADALVSAASSFQAVLAENKAKDDRLNYTLARNEIQQADLEARSALVDDRDWQKHDEKYSGLFTTARDEILSRYNLSPSDKAMISSENDLIHAQGRVSVGEHSRRMEIDEARGRYLDGKAKARARLIGTDAPTRNNIILGQLDAIEAQVEAGYMSEEEGAAERETMTQDFALSTIEAMPVEERIRVLENSLRYRKGYGEPLGDYSGEIVRAADETGLSPELIAAVIQQESGGDADVESSAGAVGLMQLREDAAAEMGVKDRRDPAQNIQGGAGYLAKQFARFGGDPEKALAAYNWGSGNLKKAIAKWGDDWLSHAPEETQTYVAKLAPVWAGGGGKPIETKGKYKTGEGPLDADAIRRGEGTGSTADFLHADTAAKLLDQAYKGDKENQNRQAAYAVVDVAKNRFKEDPDAMMAYIRANTKGSVRDIAEREGQQLIAEQARAKAAAQTATIDDMAKRIEGGENIDALIAEDTDAWGELDYGHQRALENAQKARDYGELYAPRTRIKDADDGSMSLEEWNGLTDYGPGSKTDQDLSSPLWADALDEDGYNALKIEQKLLIDMENAQIQNLGKEPRKLIEDILVGAEWMPRTGRTDPQQAVVARLEQRLVTAIRAEQQTKSPPRELSPREINGVLSEIMSAKAYIDDWGFDDQYDVATMTAEQLKIAYLPIAKAKINTTMLTGEKLTIEDFLIQKARDKGVTTMPMPVDDLQKAYFALENGLGMDAVIERLKGD